MSRLRVRGQPMSHPRGPQPVAIEATARQRALLEEIARSRRRPHAQVIRASILLRAAAGERNQAIARALEVHVEMVTTWRTRWAAATPTLQALEENWLLSTPYLAQREWYLLPLSLSRRKEAVQF